MAAMPMSTPCESRKITTIRAEFNRGAYCLSRLRVSRVEMSLAVQAAPYAWWVVGGGGA